jgi:hypothetical protein
MQFFKTFIFFAVISLFTSCDVEPVDNVLSNEITNPNNPNNPNNPSVADYFPRAINNAWNFKYNTTEVVQIKILSNETINGISFYKLNRFFSDNLFDFGDSSSYIARVGDSYIYRNVSQYAVPGSNSITIEMQYSLLKSNLEVGQTWNDDQSFTSNVLGLPINLPFQIRGKILEKGTAITLGSTTYNDVIKTEVKITFQGIEVVSNYWFAKNVGMIKAVETVDLQSQEDVFELTSFQLN